jgi:hypothetical protein
MDVNIRNDSGMPACWFAAMFLSKHDGGAMLRFMMERGIYSIYAYIYIYGVLYPSCMLSICCTIPPMYISGQCAVHIDYTVSTYFCIVHFVQCMYYLHIPPAH